MFSSEFRLTERLVNGWCTIKAMILGFILFYIRFAVTLPVLAVLLGLTLKKGGHRLLYRVALRLAPAVNSRHFRRKPATRVMIYSSILTTTLPPHPAYSWKRSQRSVDEKGSVKNIAFLSSRPHDRFRLFSCARFYFVHVSLVLYFLFVFGFNFVQLYASSYRA